MDLLRAIARRLTVSVGVAAFVSAFAFALLWAPRAYADDPPRNVALQQCQTYWASWVAQGHSCFDHTNSNGQGYFTGADYPPFFPYSASAPTNPCATLAPATVNASYTSQQTLGVSGATWTTDPGTGLKVQCPYSIKYSNYSALADAHGLFHVQATITYTGNPSGSESATPTDGSSVYNDASGNPLNPQPSSDGSTSPQLCGGTSCADPSTGNVCAVVGGGQVCQKFPAWTPNMAGGCGTSASAAICAGSPVAPLPSQGQGGVVDPSTQIAGTDKYTTMNMQTGQVSTVVVNTYSGVPGQTVSNGATSGSQSAANSSGSSKPASSSSSAGGYGGGADCNSPPACSGDAVMCGIGRQEWYAMCSAKTSADTLDKHVAGDGNGPPTFGSDQVKYGQGDAWSTPDTSQDGTVGGQANNGVYDQSGFGWARACPIKDIPISLGTLGSFNVPASNGCVVGQWLSALIVGFALFSAAMITAGGRG